MKSMKLSDGKISSGWCPLCLSDFLTIAYRRRPEDYVLLPGSRRVTRPLVALRCWRCRYFEVRPEGKA